VRTRLLVPVQHVGSVEHYYHFILGYLFPASRWLESRAPHVAILRNCGSMDPWFDLLPRQHTYRLVRPGQMLRSFAGHKERAVVLPATDNPRRFNGRELQRFAAATRGRAGVASTTTTHGIIVIDRQWIDPRSTKEGVERSGYGPTRRSIPNMTDVVDRLARNGPVDLLEAGLLSPVEQVNRFAAASIVVGQHGAGLANMLWMPTGSTVIEIVTQKKMKHKWFEALARALGHSYIAVLHSGLHDPVDPDEVAAAVDLAVAGGGSGDKTTGGRFFPSARSRRSRP
jgi:hypothetical protein